MTAEKTNWVTVRDLRLAAIDLDGTLLSPELTISAENRRAVAKLQAGGLEVALASGRHHTSIKPFALELPGVRWIVSVQGGEVSDVTRKIGLSRTFLSHDRVAAVRAIQQELGIVAMYYSPDEILTDSGPTEEAEFYTHLTGLRPRQVPPTDLVQAAIYKVVWIATPVVINSILEDPRVAAVDVQTVRTHLRLFEFMPKEVSKASGLATLAKHLGITADQAVVFGDADNDIPMFEWAAESFAMAHGWPSAKQRARRIAPAGPSDSALARAVDMLV
jgi:Cof subfamily protein (haloacid dehalogenase superfamily)